MVTEVVIVIGILDGDQVTCSISNSLQQVHPLFIG